jgi:hypothetical protein
MLEEGSKYGERVVDQMWNSLLVTDAPVSLFMLGHWDEALGRVNEVVDTPGALPDAFGVVTLFPIIFVSRGDTDAVARLLDTYDRYRTSSDAQERLAWVTGKSVESNATGDHEAALALAQEGLNSAGTWGSNTITVKICLSESLDAAFAMGDLDRARTLVDLARGLPVGISPVLSALSARARARLATFTAEEDPGPLFEQAAATFSEASVPFWRATTLIEHGEWLAAQGREAEADPLFSDAKGSFEALGATVWLDRLRGANSAGEVASTDREP